MKATDRKISGQTLLEFALVLPVLAMILIMIFDLGRAVYYYSVIYNAACEGARYGITNPLDTDGIEAKARQFSYGLNPANISVSRFIPEPTKIRVTVSYWFVPATPFLYVFMGSQNIEIQSQSTMRIEQ